MHDTNAKAPHNPSGVGHVLVNWTCVGNGYMATSTPNGFRSYVVHTIYSCIVSRCGGKF